MWQLFLPPFCFLNRKESQRVFNTTQRWAVLTGVLTESWQWAFDIAFIVPFSQEGRLRTRVSNMAKVLEAVNAGLGSNMGWSSPELTCLPWWTVTFLSIFQTVCPLKQTSSLWQEVRGQRESIHSPLWAVLCQLPKALYILSAYTHIWSFWSALPITPGLTIPTYKNILLTGHLGRLCLLWIFFRQKRYQWFNRANCS